jgi:glyoxylase-like metal-dependent hydrolase (beta-lactamase superfamily II)
MKRYLAVVATLATLLEASAHEYLTFDEMTSAFGMDVVNTDITTETVAPGLHVLFGVGGNIVASIGDQGVLIVDSQLPEMVPKIEAAVETLGGGNIDFVINTHWHWDHANGNPIFGRQGSWMVSHANSRRMMAGSHDIDLVNLIYEQPPYPAEAMPVVTFDDHMQFHFNGDTIDLFNFGPAHTTGDAVVYFRDANVVHMGDVLNNSYPFIDAGNGGDLDGMILFCEKVLARLNEDSIVVPGHGPVMGYRDLADFIAMLETVRSRISALIDQGYSLEEVIAADPTAEFNDRYGDPARFINRAYMSLAR